MKKLSILLASVLLVSILAGVTTTVSGDNLPTINSATIVQTYANLGQKIELRIDAVDADGISLLQATLYGPELIAGNGPVYVSYITMSYNTTVGMYQGFYTIGQYDPVNITIGQIYLQDNVGNYYYFYNSYLYSYTDSFTTSFISVTSTTPDYTPPVLKYISVNATSFTAGQSVNVTARVTDDISGVNYVHATINHVLSGVNYYSTEFVADVYLNVNALGNYSGLWNTYSYTKNGTYTIASVDLYDVHGNYINYQSGPNAQHSFTFYDFSVINYNYHPAISDIYFDYLTVDNLNSQTINLNFTYFGSGFSYGYFYFNIKDPNYGGNYYYGYLYLNSSDYNTTSGFYETSLSNFVQDGTSIANGTVFISYFYLYQFNGDVYTDYSFGGISPSFNITGYLNTPFAVAITPDSGNNYLGQNTTLGVKVTSNEYFGGVGNLSLSMIGPENYTGSATQLSFSSYGNIVLNKHIHFNATGLYTISAQFVTVGGTYTYSSTWWVLQPPFPEFQVSIDPSSGSSEVNQEVNFKLNVTSTFLVNKTQVQVYILGAGPQIIDQSFTIEVNALDSVIYSFNIVFPVAGTYDLNATLTDGNGYWWSTTYTWNVVDSGSTSSSSSSTDTISSSDQTTGNDTNLPQVSLPGFGFYITVIGFSFMIVTTYRSRKL